MKRSVLTLFFILVLPGLCRGGIGEAPNPGGSRPAPAAWEAYRLQYGACSFSVFSGSGLLPPAAAGRQEVPSGRSLREVNSGFAGRQKPVPRDMASMMSFVWAEMFGGVDLVAEVRAFALEMRHRGRHKRPRSVRERDSRNRWTLVLACRIDGQTQVAAALKNRGRLFGDGTVVLQVNALDPVSEEVGIIMAYSDRGVDIRADRMILTEAAAARLEVKF